ncbi:MAG: TetR family transcriptional regulator [Thermoleophilia bacterium]|nr:TetR family transcriptional regulator [Thermoleophilia bacterium]
MPPNPLRRAQLADAGIRILARDGARGLTHRALDAEAGVPTGTASNYFRTREAIMEELGRRILHVLAPPAEVMREVRGVETPTRDQQVRLIREVVRNVLAHSSLFLALLELRLEATRRPRLRATLTEAVRRTVESDVAFHEASGLPGGRDDVLLLHLTIDGLILDQLTLPEALGIGDLESVVGRIVDRLVLPAAA